MSFFKNIGETETFFYKVLFLSFSILLFGFSFFKYKSYHSHIYGKKSSAVYEQMLMSYKKKDNISVIYHANEIRKNYKESIYFSIANLFLAKNAFFKHKYKKSKEYLKNIRYSSRNLVLQNIVDQRLIKIYIIQKKWKKALILLNTYDKECNFFAYQEMKADIYLRLNEFERAKQIYNLLKSTNLSKKDKTILDMKIKYISNFR